MPLQEQGWTRKRSEFLMDATATLCQYTQQAADFARIPGYLCSALQVEAISLAIVREVKDGTHVVLGAGSSAKARDTFENELLMLYQQTRPVTAKDVAGLRSTSEAEADVTEVPVQFQAEYPRATVFTQVMEAGYRLLLVVHQNALDPHLSGAKTEVVQAVALQLAKLSSSVVVWLARPEALGEPFDRLTDREWMVLRGLNSEAGEKQLADQLGLSPHTLHSHIKSIYRKVGVQGRLPLLLHAQAALRALRVQQMKAQQPPEVASETANRAAVAV